MTVHQEKHIGYYLSLLTFLLIGIFLILEVSSSKQSQASIVVLISLLYVIWALLHHVLHHSLTVKVVLEYILVGSLAISAVLLLIQGGIL